MNTSDAPASSLFSVYHQRVRSLGDRLVAAQRPLRLLDAVKWDDSVEQAFLAADGRALPPVTADTYRARPLSFDPTIKRREFRDLEADVRRHLGATDPTGSILLRMCGEYRQVIDLLEARGTPAFSVLSRSLFGTTTDTASAAELRSILAALRATADDEEPPTDSPPTLDANTAMSELSARLSRYFGTAAMVRVRLSDGLLADAAAGCDYLKLRRDAWFHPADLDLLEVHEGWVHLGTTVNGQRQPACSFLAKGPPSSTRTQEGLAVLTEFLAGVNHPRRVRRLVLRLEGIARAEAGADFREVYRGYLDAGDEPREAYQATARLFRGSLPTAGPFTKDLCYGQGMWRVLRAMTTAAAAGETHRLTLLFSGKAALEDVDTLATLAEAGLVTRPRFVPEVVADPKRLTARLKQLPLVPFLGPVGRLRAL